MPSSEQPTAVLTAPVLVVGRGPVGMTTSLRLARYGVDNILCDVQGDTITLSSKAVAMDREALEVLARADAHVGREIAARGVAWRVGRTYFRQHEIGRIEFPPPVTGGFGVVTNFPQSETERLLLDAVRAESRIRLLLGHELISAEQSTKQVFARLRTSSGKELSVEADYLIGADGSRSTVRKVFDFATLGHSYNEHFVIADILAELPFPRERRLFFDPPYNRGRTVLIHPQPDSMWHIDFQIGQAIPIEDVTASGRLHELVSAAIEGHSYDLIWSTTYVFKQVLAKQFRQGRVFLVGDAAHLYAPYGARGLNSGLVDADNLAWKLAAVLHDGTAPSLLDTYDTERRRAALENFRVTARTADFLAPRTTRGRVRRDIILLGATRIKPVRRFVDAGKFHQPCTYRSGIIELTEEARARDTSSLDQPKLAGLPAPDALYARPAQGRSGADGLNLKDPAPESVGRLRELFGSGFVWLVIGQQTKTILPAINVAAERLADGQPPARVVACVNAPPSLPDEPSAKEAQCVADTRLTLIGDVERKLAGAYLTGASQDVVRFVLVRPDGYVAAVHDAPLQDLADGGKINAMKMQEVLWRASGRSPQLAVVSTPISTHDPEKERT